MFAHEDFDGISRKCTEHLSEPSLLTDKTNFHRYQLYTSSLSQYFPDHFPNLAIRVPKTENVDFCLKLLDGLKSAQVLYLY